MSKWKCEICNSEFENFQAQGFNNKIYCPLCYYKKLYRETELERERLNNIIDELDKELDWQLKKQIDIDKFAEEQGFLNYNPVRLMVEHFIDKLKALKEGKE